MVIFNPNNKALRSKLIKDVVLYVGSLVAIVLICRLVGYKLGGAFYSTIVAITIIRLLTTLLKDRLVQLTFDDASGNIVFDYKALLGRAQKRKIPMEETQLEVGGLKSFGEKEALVSSIAFLKGKWEAFDITGNKDGMSQDSLAAIIKTAQERGLKVELS
jgi:hypothetical protein